MNFSDYASIKGTHMNSILIQFEILGFAGLIIYLLSKQGNASGTVGDLLRKLMGQIKSHIKLIIKLLPIAFGVLMFLRFASVIKFEADKGMDNIFGSMLGALIIGVVSFGAGLLVLFITQLALNNWKDPKYWED